MSVSDFTDIDLEKQIRALRREVATLKKAAARRGSHFYDDAGDLATDVYEAMSERLASTLPHLRKRARAIEKTAYDHPATVAAVGIIVVALAASLFLRRR